MKIENIAEIFNQDDEAADKWYKVKVVFIVIDEKSGKEKKIGRICLVKASSSEDATKRLHEGMKGTMADYKIHTITETQYEDVFFYDLAGQTEETR